MAGWVEHALARVGRSGVALSVRMMAQDEMIRLNHSYRNKKMPTNVLSFPADGHDESGRVLLGDIAICVDVVIDEAREQGKPLPAHLAHMLMHGLLHLAGYDHVEDDDAALMESLETEMMIEAGFGKPYEAVASGPDEEGGR